MDEQEGQWDYIEVQTDTLCQIVVHTGFLLVQQKIPSKLKAYVIKLHRPSTLQWQLRA
jgi:hypothetical protein